MIGNQRDNGWYRLYGNDGEGGYRYDKVAVNTPDGETVYRDGFNLHIGSNSLGCVTVPLSEEAAWKNLEDTLNNTPTVAPNPNKPNDTYRGVMIVLEK